jgi:hypothetical protein
MNWAWTVSICDHSHQLSDSQKMARENLPSCTFDKPYRGYESSLKRRSGARERIVRDRFSWVFFTCRVRDKKHLSWIGVSRFVGILNGRALYSFEVHCTYLLQDMYCLCSRVWITLQFSEHELRLSWLWFQIVRNRAKTIKTVRSHFSIFHLCCTIMQHNWNRRKWVSEGCFEYR